MAEVGLFNRLLGTTNLSLDQWVICCVVGLPILLVSEICKLVWQVEEDETPTVPALERVAVQS